MEEGFLLAALACEQMRRQSGSPAAGHTLQCPVNPAFQAHQQAHAGKHTASCGR